MPDGVEAHITPEWCSDGEPIRIEVVNATHLAGKQVQVDVWAVNSFETTQVLQAPIQIDGDGNGVFSFQQGMALGQESSVYVHALVEPIGEFDAIVYTFRYTWAAIFNPTTVINDLEDVEKTHDRILVEQATRYSAPLGSSAAEGALEHRALSVIEGLLITSELRFPGVIVRPLHRALSAEEERDMANEIVRELGWACYIKEEDWRPQAERRRPLALMVFPQVYAGSYHEAAEMARAEREGLLALLALNRHARGRSVCLVVEQRLPDDSVLSKWVPELPHYKGNLAGGFIAGESQQQLALEWQAMSADPLLALCCDLLGETLAHTTNDAQYLRYWSILELLSGARLGMGVVVTLRNGSPWPNPRNNTTSDALPRVYAYLSQLLDLWNMNEASFCQPATDLLEATQVWYARRNATGHYGRFIPNDPHQRGRAWYKHAVKSSGADSEQWLLTLRMAVISTLHAELRKIAASLP